MTLDEVLPLQGRHVSVALVNQSRLDDVILEGVVEDGQLWLHCDGEDVFVALQDVLDLWEVPESSSRAMGGH